MMTRHSSRAPAEEAREREKTELKTSRREAISTLSHQTYRCVAMLSPDIVRISSDLRKMRLRLLRRLA